MTEQDWYNLKGKTIEISSKPASWDNLPIDGIKGESPMGLEYPLRGEVLGYKGSTLNVKYNNIVYGFYIQSLKDKFTVISPSCDKEIDFKEGDVVARTWPSGRVTLGEAVYGKVDTLTLYWKSLESYHNEGGVVKGNFYGDVKASYAGVPHRLATEEEKAKLNPLITFGEIVKEAKDRGFVPGNKFIDLVNKKEWTIRSSDNLFSKSSDGHLYVRIHRRPDENNRATRIRSKDGEWAEVTHNKSVNDRISELDPEAHLMMSGTGKLFKSQDLTTCVGGCDMTEQESSDRVGTSEIKDIMDVIDGDIANMRITSPPLPRPYMPPSLPPSGLDPSECYRKLMFPILHPPGRCIIHNPNEGSFKVDLSNSKIKRSIILEEESVEEESVKIRVLKTNIKRSNY